MHQSFPAPQAGFQHSLQPLSAHGISQDKGTVALQFLHARLGHISKDMGKGRPLRIMTQGTRNDLKPRPVDQFRLYTRNLFEGDVGEQNDGVELSRVVTFSRGTSSQALT